METTKVWFVTGASKGLGLALIKKLLEQNYRVAATTRNVQSLISEIGTTSETFLPLEVSLTDNENVHSAIAKTIEHFGQLDVVVNNAGYGQLGTLEELSDKEARANFDVNVFGTLNVVRNAMPHLRQQRSGHIFNISSIGGYSGNFPGWGIYCSTKFAVAGLTEALAEEIKDFGVKATVVYPGYFRTDFLSKESVRTPENSIPEYEAARNSEQSHLDENIGNHPNHSDKGAEAIIAISEVENPPVHFLLGSGTDEYLNNKIQLITDDAEKWSELTFSTVI